MSLFLIPDIDYLILDYLDIETIATCSKYDDLFNGYTCQKSIVLLNNLLEKYNHATDPDRDPDPETKDPHPDLYRLLTGDLELRIQLSTLIIQLQDQRSKHSSTRQTRFVQRLQEAKTRIALTMYDHLLIGLSNRLHFYLRNFRYFAAFSWDEPVLQGKICQFVISLLEPHEVNNEFLIEIAAILASETRENEIVREQIYEYLVESWTDCFEKSQTEEDEEDDEREEKAKRQQLGCILQGFLYECIFIPDVNKQSSIYTKEKLYQEFIMPFFDHSTKRNLRTYKLLKILTPCFIYPMLPKSYPDYLSIENDFAVRIQHRLRVYRQVLQTNVQDLDFVYEIYSTLDQFEEYQEILEESSFLHSLAKTMKDNKKDKRLIQVLKFQVHYSNTFQLDSNNNSSTELLTEMAYLTPDLPGVSLNEVASKHMRQQRHQAQNSLPWNGFSKNNPIALWKLLGFDTWGSFQWDFLAHVRYLDRCSHFVKKLEFASYLYNRSFRFATSHTDKQLEQEEIHYQIEQAAEDLMYGEYHTHFLWGPSIAVSFLTVPVSFALAFNPFKHSSMIGWFSSIVTAGKLLNRRQLALWIFIHSVLQVSLTSVTMYLRYSIARRLALQQNPTLASGTTAVESKHNVLLALSQQSHYFTRENRLKLWDFIETTSDSSQIQKPQKTDCVDWSSSIIAKFARFSLRLDSSDLHWKVLNAIGKTSERLFQQRGFMLDSFLSNMANVSKLSESMKQFIWKITDSLSDTSVDKLSVLSKLELTK